MNSKLKNILIFAAILGIAFGIYYIFFNKPATPDLTGTAGTPVTSAPTSSGVGQEFVTLLLNVRNIKLDDSIFTSPVFGVLQDYTITLVPEGNEGRVNPFAPIGDESSGASAAPSTPEITITTGS